MILNEEHEQQIYAALYAGRKIEAIKLLEAQLRSESPDRFTAPPAKGCGSAVILTLALCGVLIVVMRVTPLLWA